MQRADRHRQPLGQRPGTATPDPDLLPVLADMLVPLAAAAAHPVPEHGVAHHPPAHPGRIDALADGGHHPGPLVAEAHRKPRVTLVQVGHLTGEELDVGAADPDPLDVDDRLTRGRLRGRDLLHRALPRRGEHERPHDAGFLTDHELFRQPLELGGGDIGVPCLAQVLFSRPWRNPK
jgi:hypothetical protein